jgi:hypothetical protein
LGKKPKVGSLFGLRGQEVIEVEAFEETFAYFIGQLRFFERSMHEVDRPPCGVENDATIVTSCKMLFKFLAEFRAEVSINIRR